MLIVFGKKAVYLHLALLNAFLFLIAATDAHAQSTNQYTNTTTGTITDNNCGTAAQITRTFNVPTSYIVGDVNLGIFLSHSYRSDLRVTLTSPAGTVVTVMTWTGNVQDGDNLNDLFDDEAAAAITTHVAAANDLLTPVPPPYSHSFRPNNVLSAFDGQNASGNWTMVICDAVAVDTGQFQRADLYISQSSLTAAKSSTVISDGISPSNPKAIPGATIEYCILITNAGPTGAANNAANLTDLIPANMTYVPNSLRSGTTCATAATIEDDDASDAGETDGVTMSFGGTSVNGIATAITPGASNAMVFRAKVN